MMKLDCLNSLWKQSCLHKDKHFDIHEGFYANIWVKVFKNGPSKICGRQPLKNLKRYGLPKADHTPSNYLKAILNKFYLVHSWIPCHIFQRWTSTNFTWLYLEHLSHIFPPIYHLSMNKPKTKSWRISVVHTGIHQLIAFLDPWNQDLVKTYKSFKVIISKERDLNQNIISLL